MTEIELNEAIETLTPLENNSRPPKSLRAYRREMARKKYKRLRKIVTRAYVPHAGYVQWSYVGDDWLPTGKYIKYPRNSNMQRWMKRETSRRMRNSRDVPLKGNHYRRLFDYWWTLF